MYLSLFEVNKSDNTIHLYSQVKKDCITDKISNAFDYEFNGIVNTDIYIPDFPNNFQIGLIVGSSGSGKSTLLKLFGEFEQLVWDKNLCIASHFEDFETASMKFGAVGLNSIPTWLKPYQVLSNGEKFRADMSRSLHDNAVIDEFTSVVNRECAISCSISISKYIKKNNLKNVVFASCHDDIIEYLQPDWVYNTDTKKLSVGRCVRQSKKFIFEISQCEKQVWCMFKKYHYLSAELNKLADCYIVSYNKLPVAFAAILSMPGRFGKDSRFCVSEHRIVVLPDYQGMGLGNALSEYLGELYLSQGYRYFGKTANPRMGEHRQKSNKWRATSSNLKTPRNDLKNIHLKPRSKGRHTSEKSIKDFMRRLCYSHEYIGDEKTVIGERTLNKKRSKKLF